MAQTGRRGKAIWMDDDGPLTGVLPKLEVLAPLRVVKRQQSQPDPGAADSAQANVNSKDSSSLDFDNDESWEPNRGLFAALMMLPSWLMSFIVHLALLLVLATCTYVAQHDGSIFLEFAETENPGEMMVADITFEELTIEDSLESMEATELLESELPTVELSDQAALPDLYDTADPFVMTGLPEFSSESIAGTDHGPHDASESTEFFGTKSYGSDFVFVIDRSSSMAQYSGTSLGQLSRWEQAVNELLDTLDQLDRKQKFLVLLYNDRNYVMFGAPTDQKLIAATKENKRRIRNWLSDQVPFAGTRPGTSIRLALRKKPDAIYFLSDGELRDNTMFGLREWNRLRKGPDGIKRLTPIHTILLGSNFGRETMRTIAEENNGIFTHAR